MDRLPAHKEGFPAGTPGCVLLGLVSLVFCILCFTSAFPLASVPLRVTREQAKDLATEFIFRLGYDIAGYETTSAFESDDSGALFLQVTQDTRTADHMMRSVFPIWRWNVQLYRPGEKAEFRIRLDTEGKVDSFWHQVRDDQAGASLPREDAEAIALGFLTEAMGLDPNRYRLIAGSVKTRPRRTDYRFEWIQDGLELPWRKQNLNEGAATLHVNVEVKGDRVESCWRIMSLPEGYTSHFTRLPRGSTIMVLAGVGTSVITAILASMVILSRLGKKPIRWRLGAWFALVPAVFQLLQLLNSVPLLEAAGRGKFENRLYPAGVAAAGIASVLFGAVFLFLAVTAGEVLARETAPASLGGLFETLEGAVRRRSFFWASLRGYSLAFIIGAGITAFYMIGRKYFGVLTPAAGPRSNVLGVYLPAFTPVTGAVVASVSEELIWRLFWISFLKKYLGWTPLAVVVAAILWGLGHSGDVVFPFYLRVLEVSLVGIAFGLTFSRFDIITCLVAHYAWNAFTLGMPLVKSGNNYYAISGLIVCLLGIAPVVMGVASLPRPHREGENNATYQKSIKSKIGI